MRYLDTATEPWYTVSIYQHPEREMTDQTVEAPVEAPKKTIIISSAVANEKYPRVLGMKTPNGSPIRDCGDRVAVALRGTGMADWMDIAERNGIAENLQNLQDIGKNTGQVRMALGRMLRARLIKFEANPDKEPEPYIPDPKPMPVKAKADPKPEPVDQTDEIEEDDEVAEDSEEDEEA